MTRRLLAALALCGATTCAQAVPTYAEVQAAHRPSDVTLLDRHGVPIQTLRVDRQVRRLPWVPLADMSPALLQAIVLSEDRRFYEHSGVDWSAIAKSAWGNAWNTRTRGASTLTMQLAGLIEDGLARPAGGRSVRQKLGQAYAATRLEASWKKSEILEAYLNSVGFRGEIVGIDALSLTLFGKHPSGLDTQESAVAAALLRGPNATPEVVAQRACGVLQVQQLSCTGVTALTANALARKGGMPLSEQLAPHYARLVVANDGPAVQRGTLDAGLQRVAVSTLRRQLNELVGRNVEDGAVLVLDNASGDVLAWVGSSGDLSGAAQVDGVLARRQPGSTLKPFVYELAFERRLITPASLIDDSPAQIATQGGLYLPQNYDHDFKGWVSARTALGASLNVPAVRVGAMLGPDALVARLNALGFGLTQPGGYYGNSLALGSADVTLLALTNAYRAFANGGLYSPAVLRAGSVARAPVRVADPAAVYLVSDVIADNNARVRTFGFDSLLATRGHAAVKTGTSKDMRDNWCVGYTDRYTIGVWVGNASGAAMHSVSGVSGAAPIWAALVRQLQDGAPSRPPPMPAGVVSTRVEFEGRREPSRTEVFLAGTEQALQRASARKSITASERFGIASPRDGSIYRDRPGHAARRRSASRSKARGGHLDAGRSHASAAELDRSSWAPWPGRHRLSLHRSSDGAMLESVNIEVRGAGLKDHARSLRAESAGPAAATSSSAPHASTRAQLRENMRSIARSITIPQRL